MAKSALTQLQDQIEAIRREAFAAGYSAAMQAIQKAASAPAPDPAEAAAPARRRAEPAPPTPQRRRRNAGSSGKAAGATSRPRRGTNARLVAEVLRSMAPRAVRPAEIRSALQRDKGVEMAFTSIRHALGQLEASRSAEQVADSKTWRHTG